MPVIEGVPAPQAAHLRSPAQLFTCSNSRGQATRSRGGAHILVFMFEKLEVYQKAVDLTDEIAAMTECEGPLDRARGVRHYA